MSNGKKKAGYNAKSGNAYLAWAFVEAAHFAIRHYPEANPLLRPEGGEDERHRGHQGPRSQANVLLDP